MDNYFTYVIAIIWQIWIYIKLRHHSIIFSKTTINNNIGICNTSKLAAYG